MTKQNEVVAFKNKRSTKAINKANNKIKKPTIVECQIKASESTNLINQEADIGYSTPKKPNNLGKFVDNENSGSSSTTVGRSGSGTQQSLSTGSSTAEKSNNLGSSALIDFKVPTELMK